MSKHTKNSMKRRKWPISVISLCEVKSSLLVSALAALGLPLSVMFCILAVLDSKPSSLPDQTETSQNWWGLTKFHNFVQISQLTTSTKFRRFGQISQLQPNFTILAKFHNLNNSCLLNWHFLNVGLQFSKENKNFSLKKITKIRFRKIIKIKKSEKKYIIILWFQMEAIKL